jgi:hypothetical protein
VATLLENDVVARGNHELRWDVHRLPPGRYYLYLEVGGQITSTVVEVH